MKSDTCLRHRTADVTFLTPACGQLRAKIHKMNFISALYGFLTFWDESWHANCSDTTCLTKCGTTHNVKNVNYPLPA